MDELLSSDRIAENIENIRHRMIEAAEAADRVPQEIFRCTASKRRSSQTIKESAVLQADMFGEYRK